MGRDPGGETLPRDNKMELNTSLDKCYLLILVLLELTSNAFCFPNGGLFKSCVNLMPKHHRQQQEGESPFKMDVSQNDYSPGDVITIRLYSTDNKSFRGYQVVAQRFEGDTEELLGQFIEYPSDAKTYQWYSNKINCVTHSNKDHKTDLTLKWKAPLNSTGTIVLRAAFVKSYHVFWSNVTQTLKAKIPVSRETLEDYPWAIHPGFDPILLKGECGVTKGCFFHPKTCIGEDCTYLLTYKTSKQYIDFEMMGRAPGYVSVAFSKDKEMGEDETITCVLKDNIAHIQHGYNPSHHNERIRMSQLSNVQMKRDSEMMYCRFRRPLTVKLHLFKSSEDIYPPQSYNRSFNLDEDWYLHLGWGDLYTGNDALGKHVELPLVTSTEVDFQKNEILYGYAIPMAIQAHGAMNMIAWVALAGFAMVVSRHYKDAMDQGCYGSKIWFQVHRCCMILVGVLTASGFVLIFLYVGEWKELASVHAGFGIAVMTIVLFQIIVALCRPNIDSSKRPIFNWFHRISGKLAHICAAIAMLLGVNLSLLPVKFQSAETIILAFWVTVQILWEIVFEIMKCRRTFFGESKKTTSQSELTHTKGYSGNRLLGVTLTLYTISLLVFLAASVSLLFLF